MNTRTKTDFQALLIEIQQLAVSLSSFIGTENASSLLRKASDLSESLDKDETITETK